MIQFILGIVLLISNLLPATAPAAGALPAAATAPLNGQWRGPLKMLGGKITLVITIVPLTNGTYYAALDAPQQRISRMPVDVELKGNNLTLRIEQAGSKFVGKLQGNGATIQGIWKQPGVTAPITLKRAAASPVATTKFKPTPPYRVSDVTFTNPVTRQKLAGTVTVPAGEGPFAAAVLLSDTGPQGRDVEVNGYRMFGQLADYLTRHGVAVLRFDDRGVGKSGGSYNTATTADLVSDAQAALTCLRTQPLVEPTHVGLIGHGEGGNVALLTAATPNQPPAFAVSLAGYGQTGFDVLMRQQGEIMRLIGADPNQVKAAQDLYQRTVSLIRETPNDEQARVKVATLLSNANTGIDANMARARAVQLTTPWSRYFFDFDPLTQLDKVQCSVLLLNGADDLQVSAKSNMTPLYRALRKANRTAVSYKLDGVNHLFQSAATQWPMVNGVQQPVFSPEALKLIYGWVASETQLPAPTTAPSTATATATATASTAVPAAAPVPTPAPAPAKHSSSSKTGHARRTVRSNI